MKTKNANVSKIVTTAQRLLDHGDSDMAAVYFWYAAIIYADTGDMNSAVDCHTKSAYCYEIEGKNEKAIQEYLEAAQICKNSGNLGKYKMLLNLADYAQMT